MKGGEQDRISAKGLRKLRKYFPEYNPEYA